MWYHRKIVLNRVYLRNDVYLECGDVRLKLKESWIEGVGLVGMSNEEQPETCMLSVYVYMV
jgi:hypothetical protein